MPSNTSASTSWSEDQPVVELKEVNVIHKSRTGGLFNPDTVHAVNNVSLSVKRGETLGLVFISHDINTVRYVSDRIAVMYFGKILELNTTEEIFNNPQEDYTRTLLSAVPSLLDV